MWEKIVVALLSSDWFAAAVIGLLVKWLVDWWRTETGAKYQRYEGWAITAVKVAEKLIPDDAENAGLQRANKALLMLLEKYKAARGVEPDARVIGELENLLASTHAKLEAGGQL